MMYNAKVSNLAQVVITKFGYIIIKIQYTESRIPRLAPVLEKYVTDDRFLDLLILDIFCAINFPNW